jgi:hypothetical protein
MSNVKRIHPERLKPVSGKEIRHFRIPGTKGPANKNLPQWHTYKTACARIVPACFTTVVWNRVTCKQCRARKHI